MLIRRTQSDDNLLEQTLNGFKASIMPASHGDPAGGLVCSNLV